MSDYTDPSTIDVDEVVANILHDYSMRGHRWDKRTSWPNVTVLALAREVERLRAERDRLRDEARFQEQRAERLATDVLANVGEEWDADEAPDSIAVRYVRWVEAERDREREDRLERGIREHQRRIGDVHGVGADLDLWLLLLDSDGDSEGGD